MRLYSLFIRSLFIIFCLFLWSFEVVAQSNPSDPRATNPFSNDIRQDSPFRQNPDSVKLVERGKKILDDSTKNIYGAFTTDYYYEKDLYEETNKKRNPDTTLFDMHRYNFVARSGYRMQDLGNTGTAIKPIFFEPSAEIGTRNGFDNLRPYQIYNEDVCYFDTKSPYSYWYYVQGGNDRTLLDAAFTRNVNKNFNFGMIYHYIDGPLLVGNGKQNNNDLAARNQTYLGHFSYKSTNGRYQLLGNLSTYTHTLIESNGLFTDTIADAYQLFNVDELQLSNRFANTTGRVKGVQFRENYHLYHQFEIIKNTGIKLIHSTNYNSTANSYDDPTLSATSNFYPIRNPDTTLQDYTTRVLQRIVLNTWDNKLGVKWYKNRYFFASYLRYKSYKWLNSYQYLDEWRDRPSETFVGGLMRFAITDSSYLRVEAEYLLFSDHKIKASYHNKLMSLSYERYAYRATLLQDYYRGSTFVWDNDFKNTQTDRIMGSLSIDIGKIHLKPFASITNIINYTYYNTDALPTQTEQLITFSQIGGSARLITGKLHQYADFIYTENSATNILRMPRWFANYQIFIQSNIFKKAMFAQIGLDFHWKSAFYADAYKPVTQQFYLQDRYQVGNYLQTELFMNFTIRNVRAFLKMTNLTQGLGGKDGYFLTPDYMAQQRGIEFGLHWRYFD